MFRRLVAFFIGITIAVVSFSLVETLNAKLYPVPDNIDPHDLNAMKSYVAHLPSAALLILLLGWMLGSFLCGFIVAIVGKSNSRTPAYIAGLFLTTAGIVDLFMIPHPTWFVIIGMTVFIPFTLLGHLVAPKKVAYAQKA
jgi:hypothetical protein